MSKKSLRMFLGGLLLCFTAAAIHFPLPGVKAASASFADFQMQGDTLVKYTGTASAVSIPTSVKHIGKEAFAGHTELVKVTVPGYIESIDYNAFSGCSSLETISLPDTVTAIGNGAFSGCSSLRSMKLGKNLESLGSGVFAGCHKLSSLTLDKKNESFAYENGVIYSKDKKILYCMIPGYSTGEYKMPSTVEEIKNYAFWGCKNLKRVYLGSNVDKIPDYAFENCTALEKAAFSYSLRRIGMKAFAGCINLGNTEIPMSVSFIHDTAFDGCGKLALLAEPGSYGAEYEAKRDKTNVSAAGYQDTSAADATDTGNTGNGQGENGSGASEGGTDGNSGGTDGNSGTSEGGSGGNVSGTLNGNLLGQSTVVGGNAVVFMDNSGSMVRSGNGQSENNQGNNIQSGNIQSYPNSDTAAMEVIGGSGSSAYPKYTVVNNEIIASQAYYRDSQLENYRIPEGIKKIGEFAFARSGLASITIPEGVTTIGYGAFYHCDNLEEIDIPSSVTEIEPSAFAETKWLKERKSDRENPFVIVGDGILIAYGGMGSQIEIPGNVKQIGAEAFKGNTQITGISLPSSVTIIGEDAFAGCSNLVSISGGDNLEEIRDRAFEGCPISTIKIPASVKSIGLKAYDMSGSGKQDWTKNAVLLGKQLPAVSYETTATRLVNEEYRDAVFKDVGVAVVDENITKEDITGTVLDYHTGGFRGLVCSVKRAASGDTPGLLQVKFCMMHKAEVNSRTMPDEVMIYGKTYELTGQEDMEYLSEAGSTVTQSAGAESADAGNETAAPGAGKVTVEINSTTISNQPGASAEISGNQGNYILSISDNTTDRDAVNSAYRRAVSGSGLTALQVYNITLLDADKRIPITKLGRQQMSVTIPIPSGIKPENLKVVCLDEDGQLERAASRVVTVENQQCVRFEANHFSVYGICN